MGKTIVATIVGIVAAFIALVGMEWLGHQIFPIPDGMDSGDLASIAHVIKTASFGALASITIAWAAATFAGTFVAGKIAPGPLPGRIVLALVLASWILTVLFIPHPLWMIVSGIVLPIMAWALARRLTAA